jgi:hypothetical protein
VLSIEYLSSELQQLQQVALGVPTGGKHPLWKWLGRVVQHHHAQLTQPPHLFLQIVGPYADGHTWPGWEVTLDPLHDECDPLALELQDAVTVLSGDLKAQRVAVEFPCSFQVAHIHTDDAYLRHSVLLEERLNNGS